MCGIVGYIGGKDAVDILLNGLTMLEYRGYDSAGVAVLDKTGETRITRSVGKLNNLREAVKAKPIFGSPGIGHTRWATHGGPSEENAHPHKIGKVTVVHNGIIENYRQLKEKLTEEGRAFLSQTDTEIIAQLLDKEICSGKEPLPALLAVLSQITGSYAIAALIEGREDMILAARHSSPLVLGKGDGESFIASDIPAILSSTRDMIFLEDGDVAVVKREEIGIYNLSGQPVQRAVKRISWSSSMAEKEGYKHFMLKEIFEQPRAMTDTLRGRISLERGTVDLSEAGLTEEAMTAFKRILIVACGTSAHAGIVGRLWIELFSRVPCEVDLGSEFRYRDPILDKDTLMIAISQSGETADTLAAVKTAKELGCKVLAVCNVVDSSIARQSDYVLYTHAGPEIGVASTKAFTTQLLALYLIAVAFGRNRGALSAEVCAKKTHSLSRVPSLMERMLKQNNLIKSIAERFYKTSDFLYLGRWINYPLALEGALKLKEISYIHAEGYPAGEMKHGPIALIDDKMPVVIIAPKDRVYEKVESNMEEAKARHGVIISLGEWDDDDLKAKSDFFIPMPNVDDDTITPMITALPLQLLAYHIADMKGTDVDQPRNLAKSVTVE